MNLFGLAKKFPKGYCPHRNVHLFKHLKQHVQQNEPDFSRFLSKSSATSLVKRQIKHKRNPNLERRSEIQTAADRMRICNEILRRHYQQKRNLHESLSQRQPLLSTKLKSLIEQDPISTFEPTQKANESTRSYWVDVRRNPIDYKPQKYFNTNRWHMKIPSRKPKVSDEKQVNDEAQNPSGRRSRRAAKEIRPPKAQKPNFKSTNEKKKQNLPKKVLLMWHIGGRTIPRLK